jgi:RecA/RadA recombinase
VKTEIWFDCVDDDRPSIVVKDNATDTALIVIPAIGEKVGIWQDELTEGTNTYILHYVVDVRHYIRSVPVVFGWEQEIHVMLSERP